MCETCCDPALEDMQRYGCCLIERGTLKKDDFLLKAKQLWSFNGEKEVKEEGLAVYLTGDNIVQIPINYYNFLFD